MQIRNRGGSCRRSALILITSFYTLRLIHSMSWESLNRWPIETNSCIEANALLSLSGVLLLMLTATSCGCSSFTAMRGEQGSQAGGRRTDSDLINKTSIWQCNEAALARDERADKTNRHLAEYGLFKRTQGLVGPLGDKSLPVISICVDVLALEEDEIMWFWWGTEGPAWNRVMTHCVQSQGEVRPSEQHPLKCDRDWKQLVRKHGRRDVLFHERSL